MNEKRAVLVVGAGDATGGAIARRFAREGFIVCVTRRHADKLAPLIARIEADGGIAHGFGSDARDEAAVVELCARIERDIAPIEVAVFNVGGNVRFGITETTERIYRKVWEQGCYAGFLVGREAAKAMLPRGRDASSGSMALTREQFDWLVAGLPWQRMSAPSLASITVV